MDFVIGNWYKFGMAVGEAIVCYQGGNAAGYGISSTGTWYCNEGWSFDAGIDGWEQASDEEVKEALLKYANKHYRAGMKHSGYRSDYQQTKFPFSVLKPVDVFPYKVTRKLVIMGSDYDFSIFSNGSGAIYSSGVWATIKPEEPVASFEVQHDIWSESEVKAGDGLWITDVEKGVLAAAAEPYIGNSTQFIKEHPHTPEEAFGEFKFTFLNTKSDIRIMKSIKVPKVAQVTLAHYKSEKHLFNNIKIKGK